MDAEKIIQDLNHRFAAPLPEFYKRRIVVWIDEDQEFVDKLDEITVNGAANRRFKSCMIFSESIIGTYLYLIFASTSLKIS